jgi:hypothetical protein
VAVSSPEWQFALGGTYDDTRLFGSLAMKYLGPQFATFMNDERIPGYATLDLSIGVHLAGWLDGKRTDLRVNAINVTDPHVLSGVQAVTPAARDTVGTGGTVIAGSAPTYYIGSGRVHGHAGAAVLSSGTHQVHGMGTALEAPSWPPITLAEASAVLARWPQAGLPYAWPGTARARFPPRWWKRLMARCSSSATIDRAQRGGLGAGMRSCAIWPSMASRWCAPGRCEGRRRWPGDWVWEAIPWRRAMISIATPVVDAVPARPMPMPPARRWPGCIAPPPTMPPRAPGRAAGEQRDDPGGGRSAARGAGLCQARPALAAVAGRPGRRNWPRCSPGAMLAVAGALQARPSCGRTTTGIRRTCVDGGGHGGRRARFRAGGPGFALLDLAIALERSGALAGAGQRRQNLADRRCARPAGGLSARRRWMLPIAPCWPVAAAGPCRIRAGRSGLFRRHGARPADAALAWQGYLFGHAAWFGGGGRPRCDARRSGERYEHAGMVAVAVSLLGIWLTARRHMVCWPVNILACALYFKLFLDVKLYADMVLQALFGLAMIYGWWPGARPEAGRAGCGDVVVAACRAARLCSGWARAVGCHGDRLVHQPLYRCGAAVDGCRAVQFQPGRASLGARRRLRTGFCGSWST